MHLGKPRYASNGEAIKTYTTASKRWTRGLLAARAAILAAPDSTRPRLGAAIFSGSRLLAAAYNDMEKTSTFPENAIAGKEATCTLHAEQNACIKIRHYNYSDLICYVVRVTADGEYACSKPCRMCRITLRNNGVKLVRYINDLLEYEEMKL